MAHATFMEPFVTQRLEDWRALATQLRVDATRATISGLAERLVRAAQDLEDHADEFGVHLTSTAALRRG
jgi:hypothetical protein